MVAVSANKKACALASSRKVFRLTWMRSAISLAAILARASSSFTAPRRLSTVLFPLMAPAKSADTGGM